jgi:NAD(P)-dependent dehydrogenase (short-subunit alcohol dehydrogenase family)
MQLLLSGKTALVTGSTSGIGRAIAESFAGNGARVIVSGRNEERGHAVVQQIKQSGGNADFIQADLSDVEGATRLAQEAERRFGSIDILVNNAGIFWFAPTMDIQENAFDQMFDTNVKGPFFLTARLASGMVKRSFGRIINITTIVAHVGMAGAAVYGASKAALRLLTQAWAAEYGPHGVTVNAIAPGPIRTPGSEAFGDAVDNLAKTLPAGRPGTVDEVAAAALFLAGPDASFVNGATIAVDGGRVAV